MGTHVLGMERGLKATSYGFTRLSQNQQGHEQGDSTLPLTWLTGVSRQMSNKHLHLPCMVTGLGVGGRVDDKTALL